MLSRGSGHKGQPPTCLALLPEAAAQGPRASGRGHANLLPSASQAPTAIGPTARGPSFLSVLRAGSPGPETAAPQPPPQLRPFPGSAARGTMPGLLQGTHRPVLTSLPGAGAQPARPVCLMPTHDQQRGTPTGSRAGSCPGSPPLPLTPQDCCPQTSCSPRKQFGRKRSPPPPARL